MPEYLITATKHFIADNEQQALSYAQQDLPIGWDIEVKKAET